LKNGIKLGLFLVSLLCVIMIFILVSSNAATVNLAIGKTASADSNQSANPAANGNDNNTSTRWCAANGNTGHWWKVDLGSSQSITGSEVMWEFARNYKYKVESSTDNSTWTLRADKTANTSTAQTQTDSFSCTARYVRITVTGLTTSPTTWASFFEFRVFGNSGTTPTPTVRPGTPTPTSRVTPTPTPRQNTPTPTPTVRQNTPTPPPGNARQMENLDRGLVAVKVSTGVFVSWRVLGTENSSVTYNLYRGSTKVNASPLMVSNYQDNSGTTSSTYSVKAVVNGVEQAASPTVSVWGTNYLSVPLQVPAGGSTPDGVSYTYSANDCSVGDLDGDHQYEIVVKWDPSNSHDNSQTGYTGNVYLDAYKLNGTRLWRIDLGRNIRAGAHYTQFMVYDLDGDGKAEVACKTADGTKDGRGTVIGNASADYRISSGNRIGFILSGPEYLTIFNGQTGAAMITTNYEPTRQTPEIWGDPAGDEGNRADRFLACIAYLDGVRPSLVMCRGYYTGVINNVTRGQMWLVAYDYRNGQLTKRWTFTADKLGSYNNYPGRGNHNLSVGDVDNDGRDEIVYGSVCVDDNGAGLWNAGLEHGDAMHLTDINPDRAGLEVWGIHEHAPDYGSALLDARTGAIIWGTGPADVGRGVAADLTASYKGLECWGGTSGLRSCTNASAGSSPSSSNFLCWWDGDDLRELLDGTTISKYGGSTLLSASGCSSNNGTKSNPGLVADLLGDWREEVIFRTTNSSALRIYTTTTTTSRRLFTLMHDKMYRLAIAWQNVAYNQPPHTSFYLGSGMAEPAQPNIYLAP
jgi:rhamnogalacturonan endolyase